jgi:hypothetical protein
MVGFIIENLFTGKFEDNKGVIRWRKSHADRQYNGQKKKDIRTNNNILNTTHKTKVNVDILLT